MRKNKPRSIRAFALAEIDIYATTGFDEETSLGLNIIWAVIDVPTLSRGIRDWLVRSLFEWKWWAVWTFTKMTACYDSVTHPSTRIHPIQAIAVPAAPFPIQSIQCVLTLRFFIWPLQILLGLSKRVDLMKNLSEFEISKLKGPRSSFGPKTSPNSFI